MGGLGARDTNAAISTIVENAEGDTVTQKTLTKHSRLRRGLKDDPLIEYLSPAEQPHYILQNDTKGLIVHTRNDVQARRVDGWNRSYAVLTDRRILIVVPGDGGDRTWSLEYESIDGFDLSTGWLQHRLSLQAAGKGYTYYISSSISKDELWDAQEFLQAQCGLNDLPSNALVNNRSWMQRIPGVEPGSRPRNIGIGLIYVLLVSTVLLAVVAPSPATTQSTELSSESAGSNGGVTTSSDLPSSTTVIQAQTSTVQELPRYSIENVEDLSYPGQNRVEINARLYEDRTLTQRQVRLIAEEVIEDRNNGEIYVQIYSPDAVIGGGACGSAHWINGEGFDDVAASPYLCTNPYTSTP